MSDDQTPSDEEGATAVERLFHYANFAFVIVMVVFLSSLDSHVPESFLLWFIGGGVVVALIVPFISNIFYERPYVRATARKVGLEFALGALVLLLSQRAEGADWGSPSLLVISIILAIVIVYLGAFVLAEQPGMRENWFSHLLLRFWRWLNS